jgi:hypothetical protein
MSHTIIAIEPYPMDMQELSQRIVRRAGYDPMDGVNPSGGQYQVEFMCLLSTLGYIGARKQDDYGDFRLTDIRSWDRETWGAYWDIMRKFGRLEQQLPHDGRVIGDDEPIADIDQLFETLGDLAIYCVRMIQILRRLEEKGLVPK